MSVECPRFGYTCENPVCEKINKPLKNAIPNIRKELEGVRWNLVKVILSRCIDSEANALCVDLSPSYEGDDVTICPVEVLEGELGQKLGIIVAGECMNAIAQRCVDGAVTELKRMKEIGKL